MRLIKPIDRQLWRLAVPMILSNISVPLMGLVDTMVMGHLGSDIYLAGVAVAVGITNFLLMLFLFLRMGTTGIAAQAWGAEDHPGLAKALWQPISIAIPASILLLLCRQPLSHWAASLSGATAAVQQQAVLFLQVRWLSAPAALINMVLLGWLLGVQYARAPVILLITGNIVNILLELWLVLHWQQGVRGAAMATVIAEYTTMLTGIILVWHMLKGRSVPLISLFNGWQQDFRRLLHLNKDILLRSLLLQLCFISLTLTGARLGSDIVAVNALLMMFVTFTAYALDGFAYAVEAISGAAFGARQTRPLAELWWAACRQAALVAGLFAIAYALAGQGMIQLLTSSPHLQQLATHYLGWQVILPLAGVWCYLLDGLFVGATRGREMRNSMAFAAAGYGITLLTLPWLGNHALWLALTVFLSLRGVTLGYCWYRHQRHQSWFQR